MPHTGLRPQEQRLPPALNIIALATFAASLSARALDPVLPHVADDLTIKIATAASFASVFAFTFAIVQPVLGAAADLFGKVRLMIGCLVLLGLANILGAMSTSFPLLFATRILAGIGAGGVFSDRVKPDQRSGRAGKAASGDRADACGLDDRKPIGRLGLRPHRRFPRLAGSFVGARRSRRSGLGGGRFWLSRCGAGVI
jgi:Major Facilitator Superfamily